MSDDKKGGYVIKKSDVSHLYPVKNRVRLFVLEDDQLAEILAFNCQHRGNLAKGCTGCPFRDVKPWAEICPGCGSVKEWKEWLQIESWD